jgi:hypothetical protein
MNRSFRLALILSLCLIAAGIGMTQLGWLLYTGGSYRGQVIDAESRQAIEGAVVLFYWNRNVYGGAGGPVEYFLSAKEVLTDKAGRFYIPWFIGVSLNPLSVVLKPYSIFYYPGYGSERAEVTPEGGELFRDTAVILMRKLQTREERMRAIGGLPPGDVPDGQIPNLIRLMNMERVALGLKPVHVRSTNRQ